MTDELKELLIDVHGPVVGKHFYATLERWKAEGLQDGGEIGYPNGPVCTGYQEPDGVRIDPSGMRRVEKMSIPTGSGYEMLKQTILRNKAWVQALLAGNGDPLDKRPIRWTVIEDAIKRGLIVVREPDGCVTLVKAVSQEAELPGIIVLERE